MKYYTKLSVILSTFVWSSLCMEKENPENLGKVPASHELLALTELGKYLGEQKKLRHSILEKLVLKHNYPENHTNREDYLATALDFVDGALQEISSIPSPISPENLRKVSASYQLVAFTKLYMYLYEESGDTCFESAAFKSACLLTKEKDEHFQHRGYLFLIRYHYERDNFISGLDCFSTLVEMPLMVPIIEEMEQLLANIFTKKPQAIKHFIDTLGKVSYNTPRTDNFLNALLKLESMPYHLDQLTLYSIGAKYLRGYLDRTLKHSFLSKSEKERRSKYFVQAITYYVWSAKAGNADALGQLTTILNDVNSPPFGPYYACLLPLLRADDPEAQDLFNNICQASEESLNWFLTYKKKQETDEQNRDELEMVTRVQDNFDRFSAPRKYQLAQKIKRLQKSKGYIDKQQDKNGPTLNNHDYHLGQNLYCYEQFGSNLKNITDYCIPSIENKVDCFLEETVNQETYAKPDKDNPNYNVSTEATSTTTASSTTSVASSRKRGKKRQDQKLHQPSNTTTASSTAVENNPNVHDVVSTGGSEPAPKLKRVDENTPPHTTIVEVVNQEKSLIASKPQQQSEIPLSTISGEGGNVLPSNESGKLYLPAAKKSKRTAPRNEDGPESEEKVTKSKVRKTLERTNSVNSLKTEPKRKELRRTVTVTSLPSYSSSNQDTLEANDESKKHHTRSYSKTIGNLNPWKEKRSKKSPLISDEKDYIDFQKKSKSRRSSTTSVDHSTSESESESKKTPRKFSKRSSSSSLSSSMEDSKTIKYPTDTLLSHKMLPEKPGDYYPRHYMRLRNILTNKYNLDKDQQNTLRVILGDRERSFQVSLNDIKQLFAQFTTQGSHHGRHEVINGFGSLMPNADGDKKGSYLGQINQAKENIITIIAPKLTIADYDAAHKDDKKG